VKPHCLAGLRLLRLVHYHSCLVLLALLLLLQVQQEPMEHLQPMRLHQQELHAH
jgi:hypothetical protein